MTGRYLGGLLFPEQMPVSETYTFTRTHTGTHTHELIEGPVCLREWLCEKAI